MSQCLLDNLCILAACFGMLLSAALGMIAAAQEPPAEDWTEIESAH